MSYNASQRGKAPLASSTTTNRTSLLMRSTGGVAPRTTSQSIAPSAAARSRISSGTAYRNNSDNVSAVFGGSASMTSPTRPRTRGLSTPVSATRPASGFSPSSTTPLTSANALSTFSLPYDARVVLSSGKTTNRPIQLSTGLGYMQGFRPTMEDAHLSIINGTTTDSHPVSLFAVLDGHCGKRVADLGARVLPDAFFSNPNLGKNNALAFVESIVQTDKTVFQTMGKTDGGSTVIAAAVANRMCFVACLGDARAVIYEAGGYTVAMSEDHKPQDPKETQRIIRCGGSVQMGRVCGCLAVSRALGDFEFKFAGQRFIPNKELMVSNVADIKQINLTDQSRFLLLACDGLWDVMTNEEATAFVVDYLRAVEPPRIAQVPLQTAVHPKGIPSASYDLQRHLDQCALKLCDAAIEKGSMDNVSAMIVAFHTDLISDLRSDAVGGTRERVASLTSSLGGHGAPNSSLYGSAHSPSSSYGTGYTPLRSTPLYSNSPYSRFR